jgi:hypothetical protein
VVAAESPSAATACVGARIARSWSGSCARSATSTRPRQPTIGHADDACESLASYSAVRHRAASKDRDADDALIGLPPGCAGPDRTVHHQNHAQSVNASKRSMNCQADSLIGNRILAIFFRSAGISACQTAQDGRLVAGGRHAIEISTRNAVRVSTWPRWQRAHVVLGFARARPFRDSP